METRLTSTGATAATPTAPDTPVVPPPPIREDGWPAVLAGMREGVVACDRQAVVRAVNPAARALLPGLVEGEVVDVAGCVPFARAIHAGPGPDPDAHEDVEVDGGEPGGRRRVRLRAVELPDGGACWYLLDVTDSHRRADSLLAAEERARFLVEAGRSLHGVLSLERTLRRVAEIAAPRLAPSVLALVHAGGDSIAWARADAGAARAATGLLSVADLRTAPRLRAVLTTDVPADAWDTLELAGLDIWGPDDDPSARTLRAIAMPTTGIARGVLVLVGEGAPPDPATAELIDGYASRAGAALAAATLYREQSHLGTVLQESLAPAELPAGTGVVLGAAYRPARETLRVGGDFYEVLRAEPDGAAVLLGDVCGKGIEAAVLSGRVRQSLHALRLLVRDPVRLLALLNTALIDAAAAHGEDPRFATMVLGEARRCPERDDGSVVLDLAAGGHPPPLVLRRDGSVETVELEGMLVGAIRGAHFGRVEVVLAPGELCLLYSDGVTEARGPGGFYGEARLEAALASCRGAPAAVTCERVVQLLGEWLCGRDHDDIALLALQAPGPVR